MKIDVLGCSGGVGGDRRTTTLLLDNSVLFDAGTGLTDLEIAESKSITDVFITHSHIDHVIGLPFLVDNLYGHIEKPIVVHAAPETLAVLQEHLFNWKLWPDFSRLPNDDHPTMCFEQILPDVPVAVGDYRITAVEVVHTIPTVGYIIEGPNATVAISGDTYTNDGLWSVLNGLERLDKLIIEVSFPNAEDDRSTASRHYTPQTLAADLNKLEQPAQLLLTHFKPGMEAQLEAELESALAGRDYRVMKRGDVYEI